VGLGGIGDVLDVRDALALPALNGLGFLVGGTV
jgi:hypothetical protein